MGYYIAHLHSHIVVTAKTRGTIREMKTILCSPYYKASSLVYTVVSRMMFIGNCVIMAAIVRSLLEDILCYA